MITNTSFKEIAEILEKADKVLLFPHDNADGDGIGSCTALCLALRSKGKNAWVLTGEEPAKYISFLNMGCCTTDADIMGAPDVSMAVDCGEDYRLTWRLDRFKSGKTKVCIDHHETLEGYGDYYYIVPEEPAAAQIVYRLLKEMDSVEITTEIATAIFSGISTDTGNFMYPNTTPETHRIAADLIETGIRHNDIMVQLYQSADMREVKIRAKALGMMEAVAGGRGVISCITLDTMKECNAEYEHTETVIDELRDIEGVEIAAVLKEKEPGIIKCSLRAKTTANVAAIANVYGGGGHIKAAGFTLQGVGMDEAKKSLIRDIEKALA